MLSPHDPEDRRVVDTIVRDIGTEADLTTLVRLGRDGSSVPHAVISQYAYDPTISYETLLAAASQVEPLDHRDLDLSACALILPDRDIAYIKHGDTDVTTLPVGPNPRDDPDTHQVVADGLTSFMRVMHETAEPARRPSGRPFLTIAVLAADAGPTPAPTNGWQPPTAGPDIRGPHR